ncbi:uncharacterized protein L969DRAFT_94067 [Mixia osmundae IAM 14324]|uniref:RING-type domain-containing protein n=1 Tax=Mixia osmundae (strain CBS 9802 / IAM 14324 / JCM 22182 / KY 12970) TaxID=764103 RepID=G7E8Z8_MIXOS|nr:uncharacterized protein L969DRAFT_94067 [Mixia osmundae IAM 14324]KEI40252.1 hypothetical protein L969DRAFT_94067 [Mixia osmundae IAM 14324]GAA99616.1 hypothetical protein E5Q_06317 [Mixia osmundae IAM 14324]
MLVRSEQPRADTKLTWLTPDPAYLRHAIDAYNPQLDSAKVVQRIVHKISELNHFQYPTVIRSSRDGQVDELATRNRDLCRLADILPTASLVYLRDLIDKQRHSYLQASVLASLSSPPPPAVKTRRRLTHHDLLHSVEYEEEALELLARCYPREWRSTLRRGLLDHNAFVPAHAALASSIASRPVPLITRALRTFGFARTLPPPAATDLPRHEDIGDAQLRGEVQVATRERTQREKEAQELARRTALSGRAVAARSAVECSCCAEDVAPGTALACTGRSHTLCINCIIRQIQEITHGTARLDELLRCQLALPCFGSADCTGRLARRDLEAVLPERILAALRRRIDERCLQELTTELRRRGEALITCPFCPYSEIGRTESLAMLLPFYAPLPSSAGFGAVMIVTAVSFYALLPILLIYLLGYGLLLVTPSSSESFTLLHPLQATAEIGDKLRAALKQRETIAYTPRLVCRNVNPGGHGHFPTAGDAMYCGVTTCLLCCNLWQDGHICPRDRADDMRISIEKAMDEAIKRSCPTCHTPAVKDGGCNRLRCPRCSQVYCCVCLTPINREGYRHFCQHFRRLPGQPCDECESCELYRMPSDRELALAAAARARRAWLSEHPSDSDHPDLARVSQPAWQDPEIFLRTHFDKLVSLTVAHLVSLRL